LIAQLLSVDYPQEFSTLWETNSTTVRVPIPHANETEYYQVIFVDLQVTFEPIVL